MAYTLREKKWFLQSASAATSLVELTSPQGEAFYLYDLQDAIQRAEHFKKSGLSVHYALKANSNPRLLREFASRGLGADVVSLGEMNRALDHGFASDRVIFSGVAKDVADLEAALDRRIYQINCESFEELRLLQEIAVRKNVVAPVALRLNILLTAPTHVHVQTATPDSKFGIDVEQLGEVLAWMNGKPGLALKSLATHIGSQIVDLTVFERMARQMGQLYRDIKGQGFPLERLDLGGGLGIDYESTGEEDLDVAAKYLEILKSGHGTDAHVSIEPGRFLVARMGALLARVIYVKQTTRQNFVILNAGMNCLMRPMLYQSYHRIAPLVERAEQEVYSIVGPICESTDKFASDRLMPKVQSGDWVAIFDSGAYGAVMANTYNAWPLPKEKIWYNNKLEEM